MGSTKLKEDLSNCLINFDRPVLITELLEEYQLAYMEVNTVVQSFVEQQEKNNKLKFDKKFLVHGVEEDEHKKIVYNIVKEGELKGWLNKLKDAQSSLYSVEVSGGAKSAAPVFKPMRVLEGIKLRVRQCSKVIATNGTAETTKTEKEIIIKTESGMKKESPKKSVKEENFVKKISPKQKTSATDKIATDKKSNNKKSINNFFAPSSAGPKKSEEKDTKPSCGEVKPPTPKKMEDFFKKQSEKTKTPVDTIKKPANNTSVQLFDDEEEEPEEVSSDEEEKLEALKRDIISSDVEMENEEEDSKPSSSSKRRRILDSDDEEVDPPEKHEKLDVNEVAVEKEPVAETYLDEDGFVITKKPKQNATSTNKTQATKKTPPVTIRTSPRSSKAASLVTSKSSKVVTNPAVKTKQARIMNFFTKK